MIHVAPCFYFAAVGEHDQRTAVRRALELVTQHLAACRGQEGYHVILSDLDYLRPFLAVRGEDRSFLRELAASGRVDGGGGSNQPHEMAIQGEALIRNLLYARLYHDRLFGAKNAVCLTLGAPGHCLQLPQIAAKVGFEAIVWSTDREDLPPLCYLLGPDGTSRLLKTEHYCCRPENISDFLVTLTEGLSRQAHLGLNHDLRLLGGEMAPLPEWLAGAVAILPDQTPAALLSTPKRYLAAVKQEVQLRRATLPLLAQDLSRHHMGTVVSRAELKVANRLAENRLIAAEKFATLAGLAGACYPDHALDKAWRQVLFAQQHTAIGGTSDDISFLDLLAGYREALELAERAESEALTYLAARVDTRGGGRDTSPLVVFNSLGWPRTDVCQTRVSLPGRLASGFTLVDHRGRRVPFQLIAISEESGEKRAEIAFIARDIPSLGYRTFYLRPARTLPEPPAPTEASEAAIENEFYSVRAEAALGGGLTSIQDKSRRLELLDPAPGPGNEVIALAEDPEREGGPWELSTTGQMVRSSQQPAQLSVITGPVYSQLRISGSLPDRCGLTQEVTLYRGLSRIDLRTIVEDYRGAHEVLALTFPLSLRGASPVFEDRFAVMVGQTGQGRLDFRTGEAPGLSHSGLGAAQNWIEAGPAPSLWVLKGGTRGGAVPLGPCAIITSPDLKDRAALRVLEEALLRRGITCTPHVDTDEIESYPCAFRISLGRENAYSKRVLQGTPEAGPALSKALADAEWGAVLVGPADPAGESLPVPVLVADTLAPGGIPALAEMLADAVAADQLTIPETCDFYRRSKPLDDYGIALVNRGSVAASLERDQTLVALLFHTAAWCRRPWGQGGLDHFLVPEHKSHVFEHSLLPHPGDWRTGRLVQVGSEVNNPLPAVQVPGQSGPLAPEFSLLSVDSPNLVIAAVKPAGDPMAEHHMDKQSLSDRELTVRLYESEGKDCSPQLTFGTDPEAAWLCDLLEHRVSELTINRPGWRRPSHLSLEAGACEILTLGLRLGPLCADEQGEQLAAGPEPCPPVYCRYWDHNIGAAPVGNQPLTLWMSGNVPVGQTTRFSLGLSNDSLDREAVGKAEIIAPPEWTLIPRQVPYRIAPGSQAVYEIMVVVPPDASPCFLRAITEDAGRTIQDVLPVGDIVPLSASLSREEDAFCVDLQNPNADYVEGQVTLVTPMESWGSAVGSFALREVSPRGHWFRLEAGGQARFRFSVTGGFKGLWAVAKVMWYGQVQYLQEQTGS